MQKAKKQFGQNFLTDSDVLESIIEFADVQHGDKVLEIGPGRGALTKKLLERGAAVQAVEIDSDLIPQLQQQFSQSSNFSLTEGDILETPLTKWFQEGEQYKVVANIPYYITAPIIKKLLTQKTSAKSITLLVQKEVAERLSGDPKERSVLTVATHYYSQVTLGPVIPKKYFDPVPKVDSQLVTLFPLRSEQEQDRGFFRVVRAGFAARRKTLFNNLVASQLLTKEDTAVLFETLGWSIQRRAQELEVPEWELLTQKIFN